MAVETAGSEKQSALSGPSAPAELPWPGPRHARTPAAENEFADLLLRRAQDLMPTPIEQQALASLVGRVTAALDRLVVAPKQFEAAVCWLLQHFPRTRIRKPFASLFCCAAANRGVPNGWLLQEGYNADEEEHGRRGGRTEDASNQCLLISLEAHSQCTCVV